jgi:hypothetical protein
MGIAHLAGGQLTSSLPLTSVYAGEDSSEEGKPSDPGTYVPGGTGRSACRSLRLTMAQG